jgi:hypothetical protein
MLGKTSLILTSFWATLTVRSSGPAISRRGLGLVLRDDRRNPAWVGSRSVRVGIRLVGRDLPTYLRYLIGLHYARTHCCRHAGMEVVDQAVFKVYKRRSFGIFDGTRLTWYDWVVPSLIIAADIADTKGTVRSVLSPTSKHTYSPGHTQSSQT